MKKIITAMILFLPMLTHADLIDRNTKTDDVTKVGGARRVIGDQSNHFKKSIDARKAKNVILFIGDGMGDSEITIARNYEKGAGGFFKGIDALPFTASYTHYSLDKKSHGPDYVTDSAASGTAWASGVKTFNGAIGVNVYGKPQQTLLEMAKAKGLATGNVTTAEIQDATPAVLQAHVTHRKCYGPERTAKQCPDNALENGGLGSITEQILNSRADIILGGGAKTFAEKANAGQWKDQTLLQQAKNRGFQIVTNQKELSAVKVANQNKPVIGLFAGGNMPVRWLGPRATYKGYEKDAPIISCQTNPKRSALIPNLATMTQKAIDLLKVNPKGFFLQVEGASIDKQDHAANPCGQIGETVDLDEAVQVALDFAKKNGNTLVVVTADHAHTSQILPAKNRSPGYTQKLRTKDNEIMYIGYATDDTDGDEQTHTGTQIRIAAYGPQAANIHGLLDQTDLHFIIKNALGLH